MILLCFELSNKGGKTPLFPLPFGENGGREGKEAPTEGTRKASFWDAGGCLALTVGNAPSIRFHDA
jgi:hypothetical protein